MTRCVVGMSLLWSLLAVGHVDAAAAEQVPRDLVFWTEGYAARDMRHGIDWRWPTAEEIQTKAPKDPAAAKEAKEEAELWLRLLMNEDLVPDDVKDRMVLLDEDEDRIIARYVVADLAIYWQQKKRSLSIVVRKVSPEKATDLAAMRRLVEEAAERLFAGPNGPVPSLSVPQEHFRKTDYGARGLISMGEVTFRPIRGGAGGVSGQPDRNLLAPFWWGLGAQTDGRTIRFRNLAKQLDWDFQSFNPRGTSRLRVRKPGERVIQNWFSSDPAPEPAQ